MIDEARCAGKACAIHRLITFHVIDIAAELPFSGHGAESIVHENF